MQPDGQTERTFLARTGLVVIVWAGLTAALIGLGQVVRAPSITAFDRHVTAWVVGHRNPALDDTMRVITWIGSWVTLAVTAGVVLVLVMARRLAPAALVLLAAAWAGEYSAVNIVKYVVDRSRPPRELWLVSAHGASFPSGHSANVVLVCVAWAILVLLHPRRRWAQILTVALGCVVVGAVGFSRVELGVHWSTDVLSGVLTTTVWLTAVAAIFASAMPLMSPEERPNRSRLHRARTDRGST